jgi:hypothetical protein
VLNASGCHESNLCFDITHQAFFKLSPLLRLNAQINCACPCRGGRPHARPPGQFHPEIAQAQKVAFKKQNAPDMGSILKKI